MSTPPEDGKHDGDCWPPDWRTGTHVWMRGKWHFMKPPELILAEKVSALTRENEALKAALSTARENALRNAAGVAITPIRFECCNNPTWSGYQEDEPKCCGNPNAEWGNPGEISEAILALITKPQD